MILAALLPIGLILAAEEAPPRYAQLILRERVIIRVPAQAMPPRPPVKRWRERSYKKCISAEGMRGALLASPDEVDFILPGGDRIRAELGSSCPALDFYSGFYLRPGPDGAICADRDAIHARSGGECQIKRFRRLVPVRQGAIERHER